MTQVTELDVFSVTFLMGTLRKEVYGNRLRLRHSRHVRFDGARIPTAAQAVLYAPHLSLGLPPIGHETKVFGIAMVFLCARAGFCRFSGPVSVCSQFQTGSPARSYKDAS